MSLCHLFRSRGDALWVFKVNVNKITTEKKKRKKIGDIRNLFVSKIEGQILEKIAVKIRYNTIALTLHFLRLLLVWFQSDFGYLWNFINDTLMGWIMLNVYFVFSNFSKGTSVLFSNCFNSTSVSKYQAIYSNNYLSWFLPNLLTRNCKGLPLQRAFSHEFLQNIIGKYHVQSADYLGCKVKQLFKDLIGLNAVEVRKTNREFYHDY